MKFLIKILVLPLIIISFFISISCEESFSPRTEFQPRYILNCIIRGDTTYQTAVVLQSYDVPGYNPYDNPDNPFRRVKELKLWKNNEKVYVFKDTLLSILNSGRYVGEVLIYYLNDFIPSEKDSLKLRALLEDDRVIWSWTKMPELVEWNTSAMDSIIPAEDKDYSNFAWKAANYRSWYVPRLTIFYRKYQSSQFTRLSVDVPITFEGSTPIYSKPFRGENLVYKKENIDYAMKKISEGDPDKWSYIIYNGRFDLLILDENLSTYYSNSKGYLDDFTIRLDQIDFTNIVGGLGIFGSYIKQVRGIKLNRDYIESLGYTPAN